MKEVREDVTSVSFVSEPACKTCTAAGLCTSAEARNKEVYVSTDKTLALTAGEEVEVVLKQSMGMKAVMLCYVLPIGILLVLVVILCRLGAGDLLAALAGLLAVSMYYFVLYLFRSKIGREYAFEVRKHVNQQN